MKLKWMVWPGVIALMMVFLSPAPAQDAVSNPAAVPAPAQSPVALSPAAQDMVRMAESGVSEEVLLAFARNTQSPFRLSADAILYLKDEGIPPTVVTAMLEHDNPAPNQPPPSAPPANPAATAPYVYDQKAYPPTGPVQAIAPAPAPAPNPAPVTIQTALPPVEPAAPPPTYVSQPPPDVAYFYTSLQPYGTWLVLDGNWCWQPRTVLMNRNWRPYCDSGYWADSQAGWYWNSTYTWGWAPFHYGRWSIHPGVGWVWHPDKVWGPGWVTWRMEGDHCGWAPLPQRAEFVEGVGLRFNGVRVGVDFDFGLAANVFTFVTLTDFAGRDYVHRRVPDFEVERFYRRTTVINNYTFDSHHGPVNRGIPKERIEAVTHTQIKTMAIRNEPAGRPTERPAPAGVVYRRELKAPVETPRMVAQKVDENHPVVQHAPIVPPRNEPRAVPTQPRAPAKPENNQPRNP